MRSIPKLKQVVVTLAGALACAALAGCSDRRSITTPADRPVPALMAAQAESIGVEEACTTITPELAAWYGIVSAEWKATDGVIAFPHCKILSSIARSGAVFANYKLTSFNEHIPTVAISRIACRPTTRLAHVVLIPGSSNDWTGALGFNLFRRLPAGNCVAVTTAAHPSGTVLNPIGQEEAAFSPSNGGWSYVTGLHAITQNTTEMMRALFFDRMAVGDDARLNACIGVSFGALLGFQLMDDWHGLACDGMLLVVGGDGQTGFAQGALSVCAGTGSIPLTDQVPAFSCAAEPLANMIGLFDPAFRADALQVLANQGETAATSFVYGYQLSTRPAQVQQVARRLTPTGDLARPTIVVHSTHDGNVPAILSLRYVDRVVERDREGLLRFYLARGLDHNTTVNSTLGASVNLLSQWMLGAEPHDLVFTVPGAGTMTVKNSRDAGFASNPCGYFDFVLGSPACANSGLFGP